MYVWVGVGCLSDHALRLLQRLESSDVRDLSVELWQLLVFLWQQGHVDDVAGDVVRVACAGKHLEGVVLVEQVQGEVQQLLRLAVAVDDLLGAVACW